MSLQLSYQSAFMTYRSNCSGYKVLTNTNQNKIRIYHELFQPHRVKTDPAHQSSSQPNLTQPNFYLIMIPCIQLTLHAHLSITYLAVHLWRQGLRPSTGSQLPIGGCSWEYWKKMAQSTKNFMTSSYLSLDHEFDWNLTKKLKWYLTSTSWRKCSGFTIV